MVAITSGEVRNRVLVLQSSPDPSEAKWFGLTTTGSMRESRVCTQSVGQLASWIGGHDLQGLEQVRLKVTNESKKFIAVDNHEAVKIGDFDKNSEASKVVRPMSNRDFPELIQEGYCRGEIWQR